MPTVILFCILVLSRIHHSEEISLSSSEYEALETLYFETDGENWNWLSENTYGPRWNFTDPPLDPCADFSGPGIVPESWQGLHCACSGGGENCTITEISLLGYGLRGTLPSELGFLKGLETLELEGNKLSGSIPYEIGYLTSMVTLSLDSNDLSHGIPSTIGLLTRLTNIQMDDNMLTASLPSSIGLLALLEELDLDNNLLRGPLPSEVGYLSRLQMLDISGNTLFDGSLPSTIGLLKSLRSLYVNGDIMTGVFPTTIGDMSSLEVLFTYGNYFSGTIPTEFGRLSRLENIFQRGGLLTGSIPSALGIITRIYYINFAGNYLTGQLPSSLGSLTWLHQLDLSDNDLTGTIPPSLSNMSTLEYLTLYDNRLKGSLNEAFSSRKQPLLASIDISGNQFSGTLPGYIFNLPRLVVFAAVGNCMTGELPEAICLSNTLVVLAIDGIGAGPQCATSSFFHSRIYGSLPECIFNMPNLTVLHAAANFLTGHIPSLPPSTVFLDLALSRNRFTGSIPASLLQKNVFNGDLDLSYNRLSATVLDFELPDVYSPDSSRALKLKVNRLSGKLPSSLKSSYFSTVDMLEGNLFSCRNQRDLPSKDPHSDDTVCGSDDLDISLIISLIVIGSLSIVGLLLCTRVSKRRTSGTLILIRNAADHLSAAFTMVDEFEFESERYYELRYFYRTIVLLKGLCMKLTAAILLICVPFYCLIKSGRSLTDSGSPGYSTHQEQYRWLASASMMSGVVPAAALLVMWLVGVTYIATVIKRLASKECRSESLSSGIDSYASENSTGLKPERVNSYRSIALFAAVLILTVVVTLVINGLYVSLAVSGGVNTYLLGLLQFACGLFQLVWGKFLNNVMSADDILMLSAKQKVYISLFVFLLTDVLAPIAVVMTTDSSCFLDAIATRDEISVSYPTQTCSFSIITTGAIVCLDYSWMAITATYYPPFIYNYQCGSTILRLYSPTLMYSYLTSFALSSSLLIALLFRPNFQSNISVPYLLRPFAPSLMYNNEHSNRRPILKSPIIVATFLEHIVVVISFGFFVPYLAVITSASAASMWIFYVVLLHHYRQRLQSEANSDLAMSSLCYCCRQLDVVNWPRIWFVLSSMGAILIGIVLIDMVADNGNFPVKYLFILFPILLFVGILILLCLLKFSLYRNIKENRNNSEVEIFADNLRIASREWVPFNQDDETESPVLKLASFK
jgi:Leucine-rich repeat (LRR) protein